MRLLYVHDRFGNLAGAEASVRITATALAARGHSTALLHGPPTGRDEESWSNAFPTRFPLAQDAATRAVHAFRPDAVFIHKTNHLPTLQSFLDLGIPVARMVHDHDLYCLRSYRYNYFTRRICTRAASAWCVFPCLAPIARNHGPGLPIRWASYNDKRLEIRLNQRFARMLVVTPFMRDELLRNGFDPARIEIHPPVPPPSPSASTTRSTFSDRNLIVFAGQIIRGKGVDLLLQALAKLRSPFECAILGDGNHRPACESLARRLGLSNHVTFHGFLPHQALDAFYRDCSVVALPSVWPEPIATIGLEVMRRALPVVAFNAGGIKDWLADGHNGFLVPWMDTTTFAQRLDTLLTDKPLARRLGENGLALVTEKFNFERSIDDLESLFHRITRIPQPRASPQHPPTPAPG